MKNNTLRPFADKPKRKPKENKTTQLVEQALINQQMLMQMMVNLKQQQNFISGPVSPLNPLIDPFMAEDSKINLVQFVERFLSECDVVPTTKGSYKNSLFQFFKFHEAVKQNARPTREMILQYKEYLDVELNLRPATRGSYLCALRVFFTWMENNRLYPNVARSIKNPRRIISHHSKDSLSLSNLRKLFLKIPRGNDAIDPIEINIEHRRNFGIVVLMLRTGLRVSEVKYANIGDIDYSLGADNVFLWVRGKGRSGKDERVFLSDSILKAVKEYLEVRHIKDRYTDSSPLFGSVSDRNFGKRLTSYTISRMIKGYFLKAGIKSPRISAHSLRHTFGVLSIKSGASLYETQLAMRHSNSATTELYLGDIKMSKKLEAISERKLNNLLDNEGIK